MGTGMEWLWPWSGSPFGFRSAGELWTYDGRHVGRFRGDEVFGPNGFYLGELMRENRLIIDLAKKTRRTRRFRRLTDITAPARPFGLEGLPVSEGFEDFPRAERLP